MKYSAKDIRFNIYGKILYVTIMGVPEENIIVKNLSKKNKIGKIELLGGEVKVKWNQNEEHLEIGKPESVPNKIALVYKVFLD